MNGDEWIIVPNWEKFQHYKDRDPVWIKNHLALLHKDEYLELPLVTRGLLHGIWLAYADWNGRLRLSDALTGLRITVQKRTALAHVESLNHAGLVELSASRPLSLRKKETATPQKSNAKTPAERLEAMVINGAIHDQRHLEAEIADQHLDEGLAAKLRGMLRPL